MKSTIKMFQALLGGILLLGFALVGQAEAQTWTELAPTGGPPPFRCYGASTVYDPASNRLIFFGGNSCLGFSFNDVWILTNADGTGAPQWIQLSPTGGPPTARNNHTAVYDAANNRMIIYSGCMFGCTPIVNDVWVLSNANGLGGTPAWTQLSTAGIPTGRNNHRAAYDPLTNRMIMFGGQDGGGSLATVFEEVWVLTNANGLGGDLPTWSQLSPTGAPASGTIGYDVASMVYDSAANRMTVFGGDAKAPPASPAFSELFETNPGTDEVYQLIGAFPGNTIDPDFDTSLIGGGAPAGWGAQCGLVNIVKSGGGGWREVKPILQESLRGFVTTFSIVVISTALADGQLVTVHVTKSQSSNPDTGPLAWRVYLARTGADVFFLFIVGQDLLYRHPASGSLSTGIVYNHKVVYDLVNDQYSWSVNDVDIVSLTTLPGTYPQNIAVKFLGSSRSSTGGASYLIDRSVWVEVSDPLRNSVWVLSNANGLGAPAWTNTVAQGASGSPPNQAQGAFVNDTANNIATLYNFLGSPPDPRTWTFSHVNGLGGPSEWTEMFPGGGSPGSPHGLNSPAYAPASNRMIVFTNSATQANTNEVWVLTAPILRITMSKATYVNGDAVTATELRLENLASIEAKVEVAAWLEFPGMAPISILNLGADGSFTLPPNSSQNLGPLTLFTVTSSFPRGSYELNSRMVNPVTKKFISEDINAFFIQ